VPGAVVSPSPGPLSRREEARRDRLVTAQIEREGAEARARMRLEQDRAWEEERRRARTDKAARRAMARRDRAERRAGLARWVREHTTDLLFVPVIIVPAALAWSSMAAYGASVYGPAGLALPAFSEGAMWAFAAATTIRLRRHPGRPVWHLRAGTVIFAAYGAALNFLHGMSAATGPHGPAVGVSMALVSVAGVTAHQLVTAGPRRSRAERDQARIARTAARRERAARRAAVRGAVADLDDDGHVRLIYEPGLVALTRRYGRTHLTRLPDNDPEGDLAVFPRTFPDDLKTGAEVTPAGDPQVFPETVPGVLSHPALEAAPGVPRRHSPDRSPAPAGNGKQPGPATPEALREFYAADLASGRVPSIRQIKREWPVGYTASRELHDHLEAALTEP
jgi:hypothetical protein